jgi:peptidoglycan/xylan/chitin deacetylase (PgdA/CDA1 family)
VSVVLLYHDLTPQEEPDASGFAGALAARYKLQPELFAEHLRAIAQTNRRVGLVELDRVAPPVALSFDDGGQSALSIAEALERRDWRGHFFVVTARLGAPGFLDAAEIRDLADRGHSIGSHSHSHPDRISTLGHNDLVEEWTTSRAVLSEVLGAPPVHAAVPGGDLSARVAAAAAAAGYEVLMTSAPECGIKRLGSLSLVGRFPVVCSTRPSTVAAYALERTGPRLRLAATWRAKRLAKRLSPAGFDAVRRMAPDRPGAGRHRR